MSDDQSPSLLDLVGQTIGPELECSGNNAVADMIHTRNHSEVVEVSAVDDGYRVEYCIPGSPEVSFDVTVTASASLIEVLQPLVNALLAGDEGTVHELLAYDSDCWGAVDRMVRERYSELVTNGTPKKDT